MKTELSLHPLCTLFPRLTGQEFESLKNDIRENGLREPIIIHEGMILDGGNRYRACLEAGIEPCVMKFGGGNLVSYVISANLHRRHLTPGQQAAIVASAQDWANSQGRGGDRKSNQSQAVDFDTVEKRSAASGASRVTQMKADKVAKASPELAKKVGHGEISLPKALKSISPQKETEKHDNEDYDPKEQEIRNELYGDVDPQKEIEKAHKEIDDLNKEIERLNKIIESNDMLSEIKKLSDLNQVLESQKNGYIVSLNDQKSYSKMWKAKFEKLEKSMKASGLVQF